jgi:hypothetical protein
MSSPRALVAMPADLSTSIFDDFLRGLERVRRPVKQEFLARSKDFEKLKVLLTTLETESRRKDTEIQILSTSFEQTKCELSVSEENLRACEQANAELKVQSTANNDLYVGALMGQLCLIEAAEGMIIETREELEQVRMLADNAQIDFEQKVSEQAAELASMHERLEETTAALRAAEEMNESLIDAINEVQDLCSL